MKQRTGLIEIATEGQGPIEITDAVRRWVRDAVMREGRLAPGTWQGIYLFEDRRRPHRRSIALHLVGE
ncbi:hypothetical protein [Sphingomonas sp. DT-204]|uniref:hypothetical protein n=1 Tax=Sphingomonas sp. DT-204 TaxID=3396166 RepID=UPI003F1BE054